MQSGRCDIRIILLALFLILCATPKSVCLEQATDSLLQQNTYSLVLFYYPWDGIYNDYVRVLEGVSQQLSKSDLPIRSSVPYTQHASHRIRNLTQSGDSKQREEAPASIAVMQANMATNRGFSDRFGVQFSPTLYFFVGETPIAQYRGTRSVRAILEFCKTYLRESMVKVTTTTELLDVLQYEQLYNNAEYAVIGYFPSTESAEYTEFQTASQQIRERVPFLSFISQSHFSLPLLLSKRLPAEHQYGIFIVKLSDLLAQYLQPIPLVTKQQQQQQQPLGVEQYVVEFPQFDGSLKHLDLCYWIEQRTNPLISELNSSNTRKLLFANQSKPTVVAVAATNSDSDSDWQQFDYILDSLRLALSAKDSRHLRDNFNFIVIDKTKYGSFAERLTNFASEPAIAILDSSENKRFLCANCFATVGKDSQPTLSTALRESSVSNRYRAFLDAVFSLQMHLGTPLELTSQQISDAQLIYDFLIGFTENALKPLVKSHAGALSKESVLNDNAVEALPKTIGSISDFFQVSRDNFDAFLERNRRQRIDSFIVFFTPWCGHCVNLMNNLVRVANDLQEKYYSQETEQQKVFSHIEIGTFNAFENELPSDMLQLDGYPSLVLFHHASNTTQEVTSVSGVEEIPVANSAETVPPLIYRGERSYSAILNWCYENSLTRYTRRTAVRHRSDVSAVPESH